jgi:protein TonB
VAQGLSTSSPAQSIETPPKLNAVPHEVEVVVTGARPGRSHNNRELFTETTKTVLVFENGAVIRLGAAVQIGQLLFITQPRFKREVIARVIRKRDSRPSSCYVELEFTEQFPDFWGVEFPKKSEPANITPAQKEVAEMVQSSDLTEDTSHAPAAAPNLEEVAALRKEVEALRKKLKVAQTQTVDAIPAAASTSVAATPGASAALTNSEAHEAKAATPELSPEEEALLPKVGLNFGTAPPAVAAPKKVQLQKPKTVGGTRKNLPLAILLSAAVLLVGIGAAFFEHWIPLPDLRKLKAMASITAPAKSPATAAPAEVSASASGTRSLASDPAAKMPDPTAGQNQMVQAASVPAASPIAPNTSDAQRPSSRNGVVVTEAEKSSATQPVALEKRALVNTVSKRPILRAPVESSNAIAVDAGDTAGFMPPKLVKALRPNSPAEALQGFISGNVVLEAFVDPAGNVKSSKILSGPEKLRKAAVEAIRQYKYEPAMQNGKPVSAHVNVTIQFWYEP